MPDELQRAVAVGFLQRRKAPVDRRRPGSAPARPGCDSARHPAVGSLLDGLHGRWLGRQPAQRLARMDRPAEGQQIDRGQRRPGRRPAPPGRRRAMCRAATARWRAGRAPARAVPQHARIGQAGRPQQTVETVAGGERVAVARERQIRSPEWRRRPRWATSARPRAPRRPEHQPVRRSTPHHAAEHAVCNRPRSARRRLQPGQAVRGQHAARQHDDEREAAGRAQPRQPRQQPQQVVQIDRAVLAKRQHQSDQRRRPPSRRPRGDARRQRHD